MRRRVDRAGEERGVDFLGEQALAARLGERTIRTRSWLSAVGCGAMAGLGFWARPEVALVQPVVAIAATLIPARRAMAINPIVALRD